jgi:hypothetical protein
MIVNIRKLLFTKNVALESSSNGCHILYMMCWNTLKLSLFKKVWYLFLGVHEKKLASPLNTFRHIIYSIFISMFIHRTKKLPLLMDIHTCMIGYESPPCSWVWRPVFPRFSGRIIICTKYSIYSYSAPSLLIQFFITCLCQQYFGLLYVKCTDVCLDKFCKTKYYIFSSARTLWVITIQYEHRRDG